MIYDLYRDVLFDIDKAKDHLLKKSIFKCASSTVIMLHVVVKDN